MPRTASSPPGSAAILAGEFGFARNAVGTLRAVKIVHLRSFEGREHFEREFTGLQKFEPIARAHEGFVDILQLGRNDAAGYFYYVMELADPGEMKKEEGGMQKTQSAQSATSVFSFCLQHSYFPRALRCELNAKGHLPLAQRIDIGLVTHVSEARSFVGMPGFIPPGRAGHRAGRPLQPGKSPL